MAHGLLIKTLSLSVMRGFGLMPVQERPQKDCANTQATPHGSRAQELASTPVNKARSWHICWHIPLNNWTKLRLRSTAKTGCI
jgi:hypothetical protein